MEVFYPSGKCRSSVWVRLYIIPNQIQDWKKKLLSHAEEVFGNGATAGGENGERETEKLHAKIGQLTMAKDFLSKALGGDR